MAEVKYMIRTDHISGYAIMRDTAVDVKVPLREIGKKLSHY